VNRHGETGLVVEPGDAAALAAALGAITSDASLRERLGARAKQRVEEQFSVAHMTARTAQLFQEVLLESRTPKRTLDTGGRGPADRMKV
jgi:rhamnosyl/mannosyltransferase